MHAQICAWDLNYVRRVMEIPRQMIIIIIVIITRRFHFFPVARSTASLAQM